MEKETYKIYSLIDPITKEIRYIGVTSGYMSSRFSQHKYNSLKKNSQTYVAKWFRKVFYEHGKLPIMKLIEECKKDQWEEREKYWIKFYKNLTNIREGGKGVVVDRTKTSIERSAEAHKKQIVQLDENWNFIKEWESVKEASKSVRAKTSSSISNCIKNRSDLCFGYRWMLKEDWINKNFPKGKRKLKKVKIYQYSLLGNYIKCFDSIKEAMVEINAKYHSSVHEAAKRKGSCCGFLWSFEKLENIKPKILIHKLDANLNIESSYTSFSEIANEYGLTTLKVQTKFQNSKQNLLYKEKKLFFIYDKFWKIT